MQKMSLLLVIVTLALQACAINPQQKPLAKAATEQPAPATKPNPDSQIKPIVDQYALDRLKQMSDYLIAAKSFVYRSRAAIELQANTGQFVTFFTETKIALQRPNKLRVSVAGDAPPIHLFYEGKNAYAFDASSNVYSVSPSLATLDDLLEFVTTKAQIDFPSADILNSNPYAIMTKNLTDAMVIGSSVIDGIEVDHFAYREPTIDWEIWIAKGKKPLPMRLAMTYKQVKNHPSFLVLFTDWQLNPKLKANIFKFKTPKDAKQVEFGSTLENKH